MDHRVLLIDADPSGNATLGYFPTEVPMAGLADILLDEATLDDDVILPTATVLARSILSRRAVA